MSLPPLVLFFLPFLLLGLLSGSFRLLEIETGVAKIFWLDLAEEGDLAAEATEDMARREKVAKRAKEKVLMVVADVVIICLFARRLIEFGYPRFVTRLLGKIGGRHHLASVAFVLPCYPLKPFLGVGFPDRFYGIEKRRPRHNSTAVIQNRQDEIHNMNIVSPNV
jgi:hypothetical protein